LAALRFHSNLAPSRRGREYQGHHLRWDLIGKTLWEAMEATRAPL
jgi:hypothetical protein